jgi:hypothetical protein
MASRGGQNELLASDDFVGISAGISTAICQRYQHAPDRYRSPQCEAPREAAKAERRRRASPSRQSRRRPLLAHGLSLPRAAKTLALGVYLIVSLAEARTARDAAKKLLTRHIDPSEARNERKRAARLSAKNAFEIVAREWCENQRVGWTACWLAAYRGYRAARIAHGPAQVEKRGALEITKRLRQTVGQIFRYGIVTGRANRDPSVDLKGALKASGRQAHQKAMPREDLPEFLRALSAYAGAVRTRLALCLAVLTFVRTTELRAALGRSRP